METIISVLFSVLLFLVFILYLMAGYIALESCIQRRKDHKKKTPKLGIWWLALIPVWPIVCVLLNASIWAVSVGRATRLLKEEVEEWDEEY